MANVMFSLCAACETRGAGVNEILTIRAVQAPAVAEDDGPLGARVDAGLIALDDVVSHAVTHGDGDGRRDKDEE